MMTHYPNSDCEKHRAITTNVPICPVCLVETIDQLKEEVKSLEWALSNIAEAYPELHEYSTGMTWVRVTFLQRLQSIARHAITKSGE